jgi:hypothetical protein
LASDDGLPCGRPELVVDVVTSTGDAKRLLARAKEAWGPI